MKSEAYHESSGGKQTVVTMVNFLSVSSELIHFHAGSYEPSENQQNSSNFPTKIKGHFWALYYS